MKDEDEIERLFSYNPEQTVATLIISTKTKMTFEEYKMILGDFLHELDVDNHDLFLDDSYKAEFN